MISSLQKKVDGMAEFSHKSGIYRITQNITGFLQNFESLKSRSVQIKWQYGLLSVNTKLQKDYLNMNPVCLACLCVTEWCRCSLCF